MFRKKNQTPTMTAEEILLGIDAIKRRSKLPRRNATFLNSYASKKSLKELKRKHFKAEIINLDGDPAIAVSW